MFYQFATGDPKKEALIFVHGFNNTFEDSAYRFAQILYDLHYEHPAILFAWASKGDAIDYIYDKESAEIARGRFAELVRTLRAQGVEKINVIAHSMGNYLAVAALADSADSVNPDRVDELVMAAPDIGRDYLALEASKLTRVAHGITLYACATDRALLASKSVNGEPRAGDVSVDGPLVLPGIDTIDVTALGENRFGLNHDVFATNRSVIEDIYALLRDEKPPPRLAQIRGMPDGVLPARFWRYLP